MDEAWDYLVTLTANTGSEDLVLRFSVFGYTSKPTDDPPNMHFPAYVLDPGQVSRSLYSPGKTRGQAEADFGLQRLSNVNGETAALRGYAVDGRENMVQRIRRGAALSTAVTVLRATMEGVDSPDVETETRIRLYDRRLELEKPLQANRYSGETTSGGIADHLVDGTPDQENQPKPLAYGAPFNVPLPEVNPFDGIYQAHDGEVASIAIYDGGVTLDDIGDFATVALLWANLGTLRFPDYGTVLDDGIVMPFGAINFKATANVVEGAAIEDRNASAVVQRMLAKGGVGSDQLDLASFATLATLAPEEVGIWIDDDRSILAAVDEVLQSIGGWIVPDLLGKFAVGRLLAPGGTPAWRIYHQQVQGEVTFALNPDFDKGLPIWKVTVRYLRNWSPMGPSDMASTTSGDRKGFLTTEWREAVATNDLLHTLHPEATELVVETMLTTKADAEAEAVRLLTLYGVDRHALVFTLDADDADDMVLGSSGLLTLDLDGYEDGRDMLVIGRTEIFAEDSVAVTVWG